MTDNLALNTQLASLLSQCAKSDEAALIELYHLTAAHLMAVQVRILGMNAMAERALHDTYTRIWIKSSEYTTGSGQPMPWLISIARNHALNLRRARLTDDFDDYDIDSDDTVELLPELADSTFLKNHPDAQALHAQLNRLDVHACDSIIRSYIDGWSINELSLTYDKPAAEIQKTLHKGMLSLRGHG